MALEFQDKAERTLSPIRAEDLSNQLCVVYTELYRNQFDSETRETLTRELLQ